MKIRITKVGGAYGKPLKALEGKIVKAKRVGGFRDAVCYWVKAEDVQAHDIETGTFMKFWFYSDECRQIKMIPSVLMSLFKLFTGAKKYV